MKKTLLLVLILFIVGCDQIDEIKENASTSKSYKGLKKLCKNDPKLVVCTSNIKRDYLGSSIDDIFYYMKDESKDGFGIYRPKDDINNEFFYMKRDENQYRYGDCEDYAISFIEDLVNKGLIENNSIQWMFGTVNGDYHAWIILSKNGKKYIFDTFKYHYGEELSIAYSEDKYLEIETMITY